MGFSVFVELLNLRLRPRTRPLHLRPDPSAGQGAGPDSPGWWRGYAATREIR